MMHTKQLDKINRALAAREEVLRPYPREGDTRYQLCKLTPVRVVEDLAKFGREIGVELKGETTEPNFS